MILKSARKCRTVLKRRDFIVSVLLSAHAERVVVSLMRDIFFFFLALFPNNIHVQIPNLNIQQSTFPPTPPLPVSQSCPHCTKRSVLLTAHYTRHRTVLIDHANHYILLTAYFTVHCTVHTAYSLHISLRTAYSLLYGEVVCRI